MRRNRCKRQAAAKKDDVRIKLAVFVDVNVMQPYFDKAIDQSQRYRRKKEKASRRNRKKDIQKVWTRWKNESYTFLLQISYVENRKQMSEVAEKSLRKGKAKFDVYRYQRKNYRRCERSIQRLWTWRLVRQRRKGGKEKVVGIENAAGERIGKQR